MSRPIERRRMSRDNEQIGSIVWLDRNELQERSGFPNAEPRLGGESSLGFVLGALVVLVRFAQRLFDECIDVLEAEVVGIRANIE